MIEINYVAVAVTTLGAFMYSSIYYIIFAKARAELSEAAKQDDMKRPQPIATKSRNLQVISENEH